MSAGRDETDVNRTRKTIRKAVCPTDGLFHTDRPLKKAGHERTIRLERVRPDDWPRILELNDSLVHFLSPLDEGALAALAAEAALFLAARDERGVAAFLLALREGSAYASPNYLWFSDRYEQFLYVDRVVVDEARQREGLGRLLYEAVFEKAEADGVDVIAAEIDLKPKNPVSLAFHAACGFREAGRQIIGSGKEVSLQICRLGITGQVQA